jgi:SPP1 gp7 family putative phage head morphogenesis protein
MADKAHVLTDKKLEEMEKHLSAIYSEAQKDIQKKADEYFDKFKKADEEKRKLVKQGKLTEDEYKQWRQNKIMYGKRFTAMKEDVAKQLLNVNQTATAYINGELPEVYALNYNALADSVDGVGGYSFTLVDRDTVKHLATTDKSLLPFRELDPAKDIPWNMKKINSQVLQGIVQGESIPKISKRILNVQEMNKDAAIRSARTIVTGAENKGRLDSFKRAEADGIILEKEWIATSDSRTRDWHNELDGATMPIDKPFENAIGKIMFPGDPSADGANVYNCRCSMASVVKGFKKVRK